MPVTITVAANGGLDLLGLARQPIWNYYSGGGRDGVYGRRQIGAFDGNDADVRFVIQGTGFTFSGSFPAIELTGGTIADITMQTEAGVTLATFFGFAIDGATFAAALDTYSAGGPGTPDPSALDAIFRALSYNTAGGGGNDTLEGGDLAMSSTVAGATTLQSAVRARTRSTEGQGPWTVPPTSPRRLA